LLYNDFKADAYVYNRGQKIFAPTGFLKNEEVSDMNKTAGPRTDAAMGRNV
jgi:hypothetical protein